MFHTIWDSGSENDRKSEALKAINKINSRCFRLIKTANNAIVKYPKASTRVKNEIIEIFHGVFVIKSLSKIKSKVRQRREKRNIKATACGRKSFEEVEEKFLRDKFLEGSFSMLSGISFWMNLEINFYRKVFKLFCVTHWSKLIATVTAIDIIKKKFLHCVISTAKKLPNPTIIG